MRIVFMGTPEFAKTALEALVQAGYEVPLVITQPDKPKNRGHKMQPTPVKEYALTQNLDVFQPVKARDGEAMGIAEELGGFPAIAAAVIILTGVVGNVSAKCILRLFKITEPLAKGLGIGAASHAIGTSRAMEMGSQEGAASSLAIVVSGLLTILILSVYAAVLS